jgi:hypothetical protein
VFWKNVWNIKKEVEQGSSESLSVGVTRRNLDGLSARWATCGDDTLHGFVSLLTVLVKQNPVYTPQYSSF